MTDILGKINIVVMLFFFLNSITLTKVAAVDKEMNWFNFLKYF